MKRTILTISIILVFGNILHCQNIVNDNLISFFFSDFKENSDFEIDKVYKKVIQWHDDELFGNKQELNIHGEYTIALTELDSVKKYFSNEDIDFIKKQIPKVNRHIKWNEKLMSSFTLIDSTELDRIAKNSMSKRKRIRNTKNNFAYIFSIPIFSKDFNRVIIQEEYFCGFLCAQTCIYIYEKQENGKWKKLSEWECWAS